MLNMKQIARQCNKSIGLENWQNIVSELTLEAVSNARHTTDMREFIGCTLAYDPELVASYFVKNGDGNDLINLAISSDVINPTGLLIDYINTNVEEHADAIRELIPYYVSLVPHFDLVEFTEFVLENGHDNYISTLLLNGCYYALGLEEQATALVNRLLELDDWAELATVFTHLPGLIGCFDEDKIKNRLSEAREDEIENIKVFAAGVFHTYNMDTEYHLDVMSICNNDVLNQAFRDLAADAFNALGEEGISMLEGLGLGEPVELTLFDRKILAIEQGHATEESKEFELSDEELHQWLDSIGIPRVTTLTAPGIESDGSPTSTNDFQPVTTEEDLGDVNDYVEEMDEPDGPDIDPETADDCTRDPDTCCGNHMCDNAMANQ